MDVMLPEAVVAVLLPLYYLVLAVLAFYGLHRFHLLARYWRSRRRQAPTPPAPERWSRVTVQLPLYNELYVAGRLIEAVCRLDYPRHLLEIQVLDDSTDETSEIVAELVARFRRRGFDIHHLRRAERAGYKAGALAAGLKVAKGELIAVFDADFVPPPDFLLRTVPHFTAGEASSDLGLVQARWEHINREYSLLTRVQAIFLDGHFLIEHTARHRSGCFFNFNGTAGVWRRRAIEEAGGWSHDTLTEDLDLSYRAQLAGWRFLYLPRLAVPAELPVDIRAFKSQQHRWAKGSIQSARKLLAEVLRAPLAGRVKLEAFIHLTNNSAYALMLLLSLLVFPAMAARRGAGVEMLLLVDLPLFLAATVSVLSFYTASQVAGGGRWWRRLAHLPSLMGLGIGLSVNNGRAVLEGLGQRGGVFHRTPKYRVEDGGGRRAAGEWRCLYRARGGGGSPLVEGLLALHFSGCFAWAVELEMWMSLPFLYLFLQGYWYIFLLSVLPARWREAPRRARRGSRMRAYGLPGTAQGAAAGSPASGLSE